MVVLPFNKTWIRASVGSCNWKRITACTSTDEGMTCWKGAIKSSFFKMTTKIIKEYLKKLSLHSAKDIKSLWYQSLKADICSILLTLPVMLIIPVWIWVYHCQDSIRQLLAKRRDMNRSFCEMSISNTSSVIPFQCNMCRVLLSHLVHPCLSQYTRIELIPSPTSGDWLGLFRAFVIWAFSTQEEKKTRTNRIFTSLNREGNSRLAIVHHPSLP